MKLVFAFSALLLATGMAFAETVDVYGTDAIYGAGLTGNGTSTAPVSYGFTDGTVLTVTSVTGATGCCSESIPPYGADGGGGSTDVTALNGISGIVAPTTMFLAGVFVDSSDLPTTGDEPATLSYGLADTYELTFDPLMNQAFFIGDGLTDLGAVQSFYVPDGADTLLLGFVDSYGFHGVPSYYGDNPGYLTVTFSIATASTVPLPASALLLLAGLGALAPNRPAPPPQSLTRAHSAGRIRTCARVRFVSPRAPPPR